MKNQGCIIAGCAGSAIGAVILAVIVAAGGFYFYSVGQAKQERQERRDEAAPQRTRENSPLTQTAEPTNAIQDEMVARVLEGFQEAIRAGSFRDFHAVFMAHAVRNDITPEKFDQAFRIFLASKINIQPEAFRRQMNVTKRERIQAKAGPAIIMAGKYLTRAAHGASLVTWDLTFLYEPAQGWGVGRIAVDNSPQ